MNFQKYDLSAHNVSDYEQYKGCHKTYHGALEFFHKLRSYVCQSFVSVTFHQLLKGYPEGYPCYGEYETRQH